MKTPRTLFFLILFVIPIFFYAQTNGNITEWWSKGMAAINQNNYEEAIRYYEMINNLYEKQNINGKDYAYSLSILAICYSGVGDFNKAVEIGNKALIVTKNTFGENHIDYAMSLSSLASIYNDSGDYAKAVELSDKALIVIGKILGEKNSEYANMLSQTASYYAELGNYSNAVELSKKALDIRKETLGVKHPEYAISLITLFDYYFKLGNYSKAVELGNEALRILRTTTGEHSTYYAAFVGTLAIIYSHLGDKAKAVELGDKGFAILKDSLDESHPIYIEALSNLAGFHSDIGNYPKAIEYGNKVAVILKTQLGEEHPDFASSLMNLALYHYNIGNNAKAIELGEKALNIFSTTLGENSLQYTSTLNDLALYYSDLSNYSRALELCTKALEIEKSILGTNHPDYASTLHTLAGIYIHLGDFAKALGAEIWALGIYEKALGQRHPKYASALNDLARIYYYVGNYAKAIEIGKEAMGIRKETFGEKSYEYTISLNNLSLCYSSLGDYSKAIELGTKALEIRKDLFGENYPDYAISLSTLADIYFNLGDYSKGVELDNKAMEIIKETLGENHPFFTLTLHNLALGYSNYGSHLKALEYCKKMVSIVYSNILHQFTSLTSNQRTLYWERFSNEFSNLYPTLTLRSSIISADDLYNKTALFVNGLLLTTEMEMYQLIQESGDDEALKIFEDLQTKKLQIQKLYEAPINEQDLITNPFNEANTFSLNHEVDALSLLQETDQLEKKLIERSKVYGDFTTKLRTTWQDVQKSLADDEIAVEFLSFHVFDTDSTMLAALTLRKDDSEPKFIPLFEKRQLLEVSDTEHFICPEVTDFVWKPIQNELQGIRRIYFSPSGVLHKIGIEYLPGMENYEMYRLSTTREIIDRKTETAASKKENIRAVLYGGVNYEKAVVSTAHPSSNTLTDVASGDISQRLALSLHRAFVDSLDVRGMTASYLPSTLTEVQNISTSLKKANCPTIIHVGTDATETSVKTLSGNAPAILHISTHGFYFSEKQTKKEDRPRFLGFEDERSANVEDKTLTRSGLLMAGANRSLKGEDIPIDTDDGILTAQEISRLDFRGTKLVVLSACETGRGDIIQGEGVFGLQRGFKKAGVQTILMSLWKVSDISTEMLMTEFYKNICEGKSKRESLRMAQKKVREFQDADGNYIFKDPHYWAGFIMLD